MAELGASKVLSGDIDAIVEGSMDLSQAKVAMELAVKVSRMSDALMQSTIDLLA